MHRSTHFGIGILALATALCVPRGARAIGLTSGVAPLVYVVEPTRQHRFRRQATVELHGALSYTADAAGAGVRFDLPMWPSNEWHRRDSLAFSAGFDVLVPFEGELGSRLRLQFPMVFVYHVVISREFAMFIEAGTTPEVNTESSGLPGMWPTFALGVRLQFGPFGPREFGVPPPYTRPLGARRPPMPVSLVLRTGFPSGLQLGLAF